MPDPAASAGSRTRLAVLGSPIGHSLSPRLHAAAYAVLGLPWTYEAVEVRSGELAAFVDSLDDGWRGLSLTMPLKREVLELPLSSIEAVAHRTGSANTLLIEDDGVSAENTDVHGIVEALRSAPRHDSVHLLGSGATTASAVVAVARLGAERVHLSARSPAKREGLVELGREVGLDMTTGGLGAPMPWRPDIMISTLPGGTLPPDLVPDEVTPAMTLLDVAYDPWPSTLAERWSDAGGRAVSGIEMLIHQAVGQIRIFVHDDSRRPLPDEERIVASMRESVARRR